MIICRVPGCKSRLYRKNASGVCIEHLHTLGHCGCTRCAPHQLPEVERAGVRKVELNRYDTHSGHDQGTMLVSLPREPWEVRA